MPNENDLNTLFNSLNPISDNFVPNKNRLNLSEGGLFSQIRESLVDRYKSDILAGNTEYKAIVLKVLGPNEFGGTPAWLNSANQIVGNKTDIIRVVAAIPHLHAALPWPEDENDIDILSFFPAFEGASSLGIPVPGQIVRVTFQNIYNQTGPIYLGMATGQGGASPNVVPTPNTGNSKSIHKNGAPYNNEVSNEGFVDVNYPRTPYAITQIVIHESITNSTSETLAALRNKKDKLGQPNPLSVHYIIDKSGTQTQYVDLNRAAVHGDGEGTNHNQQSIGIEIVSPYYATKIGSNDKSQIIDANWAHRGKYVVPSIIQLEAAWQLIKKLSTGVPSGVSAENYKLKLIFPATIYEGTRVAFHWGRWSGHNNAIGIMAHARWGHSDGLFIEHYCLCRSLNIEMSIAYQKTIKNAQLKDRKTYIGD